MAEKRRISDGATFEEVQALLLNCVRRLRALTPLGADLSELERTEAEIAWLDLLGTWLAANPNRRTAIVLGSDQSH
jgi:hypothetical protein